MSEPSFSEAELHTLAAVLDEIIPPSGDGRLPGAGTLGLADKAVQDVPQLADIRNVIGTGLAALDALADARHAKGFAALSRPDRLTVLNELASNDLIFFLALTFHACIGYYQSGRVLEALGREPRPPHPKGYELPPNDLTLLDTVRRRPKMYRPC